MRFIMRFIVIATDSTGSESVVYETNDRENASCYAESHFIRNHAHKVRAVDSVKRRTLTDRDGREYVWERLVA